MLTLAVLVTASRVVNRDHCLTDVVVGALVALCILDTRHRWPLRALALMARACARFIKNSA